MLEKFHTWAYHHPSGSNDAKALPETITTNEFLTQVTIYWLTNTMAPSTRLYYEAFNEEAVLQAMKDQVKVPTGVTYYPGEVSKVRKKIENRVLKHSFFFPWVSN